jgi:coenzyme F420-0:L-glutamate ligase/coenzyme F420-1:gamma-L-glutamate ligase
MDRSEVRIIGVKGIPLIKAKDDLGKIICDAAANQRTPLLDEDILVVTQKIVSKAEGRVFRLKDVKPSYFARTVARRTCKEPELVELILRESKSIVRMSDGHLITKTRHGWVFANSGVDRSNISGGDLVSLLPVDPDESASRIRKRIKVLTGVKAAVIVSDTSGRPWRIGHIDVAIGSSGIEPILNLRGKRDLFGYSLKVKKTAIIDELASAAELVVGNAMEKIPVAIIRGYKFPPSEKAKATELVMPKENNLFP